MKYRVYTQERTWSSCHYIVEANSEEEIWDYSYEDLQDGFINEDYGGVDGWEIESIEPLEDE